MLKTISILVILAAGIALLSYFYKPSRLELTPHMVILKVGKNDSNYPYTQIKKETQNFSNLKVEQYVITSGEEKFVFEKAKVEGLYEFNPNGKEIISKIFDLQRVDQIASQGGLEALQLVLKNGEKINLFVLARDPNELKLLYGISPKAFDEKLMSLFGKKASFVETTPLHHPITLWKSTGNSLDGIVQSSEH